MRKWFNILFRSREWLHEHYCKTGEHVHIWARYGLTQLTGMPTAKRMWYSRCSLCPHGAIHNEPPPKKLQGWRLLPFPATTTD